MPLAVPQMSGNEWRKRKVGNGVIWREVVLIGRVDVGY